jgi:hypothetical protein
MAFTAGAGLIGLVLAAVAAYLLKIGYWPRRRGKSPHCRGCGYSVVGIDSAKCPECGSVLSARGAVVRGERRRRPGPAWAGAVLAVAAALLLGALASGRLRAIDWYSHRPTGWVTGDLSSFQRAGRAWDELQKRSDAGRLSADQHAALDDASLTLIGRSAPPPPGLYRRAVVDRLAQRWPDGTLTADRRDRLVGQLTADLRSTDADRGRTAQQVLSRLVQEGVMVDTHHAAIADAALAQQGPGAARVPSEEWLMAYLGQRELSGKLSPQRRKTLFDQMVSMKLRVRPRIAAGAGLPYELAFDGKGPGEGWWTSEEAKEIRIDGKALAQGHGESRRSGFGASSSRGSVAIESPGVHTIEIDLLQRVYAGDMSAREPSDQKPRAEQAVTLSATFEAVLPGPEADPIRLIDDPSLEPALRANTAVKNVRRGNGPGMLQAKVEINSAPAPLAFDVLARIDGKEYSLGHVSLGKGRRITFGVGVGGLPPEAVRSLEKVDIILRSSEAAARRTIDITEVWKGELVFGDVPVDRDSP